jgi:multidrug efflux pump subunit AcrA (membrane-fusion protein)
MKPFAALLVAACLGLVSVAAWAQAKAPEPAAEAPKTNPNEAFRSTEITFFGKMYSPLKISVFLPYQAKIMSVTGQIGQRVKHGDILATYELPLESRMDQRSSLSPTSVKDLEYQLSVVDNEIDKLSAKAKELDAMKQRNMASPQSLDLTAKEIESARKRKASLNEQLIMARELLSDRVELAKDRFGNAAGVGKSPKDGIVKAPCDGYVMWQHPALRAGVILGSQTELFQVGTLNPMVVRAQVHEIEAFKIKEGEKATVTFDSIPGKKFTATVSRIPWSPLPSTLQQPSYYEIELTIANPDLEFREGLKAQITIQPGK